MIEETWSSWCTWMIFWQYVTRLSLIGVTQLLIMHESLQEVMQTVVPGKAFHQFYQKKKNVFQQL